MFKQVYSGIKENRKKKLNNETLILPFPFPKFAKYVPGIPRQYYFGITANQKVGKSQITDEMFLYSPFEYWLTKKDFKLKIFYFTLELSSERKYKQAISRLLYRKFGNRFSPMDLDSKTNNVPTEEIIKKIDGFENYFRQFESVSYCG